MNELYLIPFNGLLLFWILYKLVDIEKEIKKNRNAIHAVNGEYLEGMEL